MIHNDVVYGKSRERGCVAVSPRACQHSPETELDPGRNLDRGISYRTARSGVAKTCRSCQLAIDFQSHKYRIRLRSDSLLARISKRPQSLSSLSFRWFGPVIGAVNERMKQIDTMNTSAPQPGSTSFFARHRCGLVFSQLVFGCGLAFGQPGSLDMSLNTTGVGAGGIVYSVVMQPDGKLVIGGAFTTYNDTDAPRIARLNIDGSLDTSFTPNGGVDIGTFPANAGVYPHGLLLQPDGKILIAGPFENVDGVSRNGIARLNTDGTLDTTFDPGTGADDHTRVLDMALQNDGKVLIGGEFNSINGTARTKLARLNSNGKLDTGFKVDLDGTVRHILILADGKLLISGQFSSVNGTTRGKIARLNPD